MWIRDKSKKGYMTKRISTLSDLPVIDKMTLRRRKKKPSFFTTDIS